MFITWILNEKKKLKKKDMTTPRYGVLFIVDKKRNIARDIAIWESREWTWPD